MKTQQTTDVSKVGILKSKTILRNKNYFRRYQLARLRKCRILHSAHFTWFFTLHICDRVQADARRFLLPANVAAMIIVEATIADRRRRSPHPERLRRRLRSSSPRDRRCCCVCRRICGRRAPRFRARHLHSSDRAFFFRCFFFGERINAHRCAQLIEGNFCGL